MFFLSEANMFKFGKGNIEAQRTKLLANCDSSEAKRTRAVVKKFISKRSEQSY
jgi:hypothetical protein